MKAEELNKLMEAYKSVYAPKEEVVESEQLDEGMGLVTGTAKAVNAVLKPKGQTPEEGKEAVRRLTNTMDVVAKPVKSAVKAVLSTGGRSITAGGGTPDTEKSDERIRELARQRGTLKQDVDLFDIVKGHLMSEGYADTEEAALAIMANMSEEWRQSILSEDPVQDYRDRRRAAENKGGARGPELSHGPDVKTAQPVKPGTSNSATIKPEPRSREFSHGGSSKPRSREFTNPPS